MKNRFFQLLALVIFSITSSNIYAQCSTCSAATESSLQSGSTAAKGINNGILYLLVMPIIVAIVFFVLYRYRKNYLAKFEH